MTARPPLIIFLTLTLQMRVPSFALLLVALYSSLGWSACPPYKLSDPSQVKLEGDSLMIVVHATSTHDARFSTKRGIDEAVRFAKSNRIPVVYLEDDTPQKFYFTDDCAPAYRVLSQGGEIGFDVPASHLYIVGGHLELCMSVALHDILLQWAAKPPRNRTVTYFMDGIYSNGKMIEPEEPFYRDFERFMSVVTYGRPGGEHWPKLSLLETMGIIVKEEHELEFLKKTLPRWDRTMPRSYRVELQMNDSVKKILRSAPGWRPPTLSFHYVDSAANLATAYLAPSS